MQECSVKDLKPEDAIDVEFDVPIENKENGKKNVK